MLLVTAALTFVAVVKATAVLPRDPPQTYGQWSSIGCWGDSPVNRTLHYAAGTSSSRTVENCLDTCASLGFPLGGIEYASECYCGYGILYNYGSSTTCNMACSGNANEICGGPNGINIYQYANQAYTVGPASFVTSYNGYHGYSGDVYEGLCYQYGSFSGNYPNLRFEPVPNVPEENMTVQKCIDGCYNAGYRVAGLRFGQECWCDYPFGQPFKLPIGNNLPNSVCNTPCTGDATEACGGFNVLTYSYA